MKCPERAGKGGGEEVGALKSITMKSLFSYLFGSLDARDKCAQRAAAGRTGAGGGGQGAVGKEEEGSWVMMG